jgi:predicted permease
MKRFFLRLWRSLSDGRADRELAREIDAHLALIEEDFMRRGMPPDEARSAARRAFGGIEQTKEVQRDARSFRWLGDARRDVDYALRMLRRSPGFASTAIVSLALGIGANVAIFSVLDAVLLRSLNVRDPRELVEISRPGGRTLSYPLYEIFRGRDDVFAGAFSVSAGRYAASIKLGRIDAGDAHLSPVSPDYFSVLGITPLVGRGLTEADIADVNAAVISHDLWVRAFGSDPAVLGQGLRIGSRTCTIVGVGPAGFRGIATGQPVDVWVPISWNGREALANPDNFSYRIIARRKPGVSEQQAQATMSVLARQYRAELEVTSAHSGLTQMRRRFGEPLIVLMSVVAMLLLIASANVANLLLARASAREREIAVRLSIGASRGRLVRQLLTESSVLGVVGGAFALLAAPAAAAFLVDFLSLALGTVELSFSIDARMFAFTLFTLIVVVVLFGLVPALAGTRLDLSAMLKSGGTTSPHGPAPPGKVLVVAQVAISCVLLVGAVLFARSLRALTTADLGFQPENVLLMSVDAATARLTGTERVLLFERLQARFETLPGVRSASFSSERLFGGNTWTEPVSVPGDAFPPQEDRSAVLLVVSPGFFRTMQTPILRGRDFDQRDDERTGRVAIVNEAAARFYFGTVDPVNRTFRFGKSADGDPITVIGVARDARYRAVKDPAPRIVYLLSRQITGPVTRASFAVRTVANPEAMEALLSREARAESPDVRLQGATTQRRLVDGTIAQERMLAQLSGAIGFVAALLVSVGLYGITAYEVSRRTTGISIRMALGARAADVVRSVVGRALLLVGAGLAVGLSAALGLGRLVQTLLFDVRSTDLLTFALSAAMLVGVTLTAASLPARRASRVEPMRVLRGE